jgi:hypothetical protein
MSFRPVKLFLPKLNLYRALLVLTRFRRKL